MEYRVVSVGSHQKYYVLKGIKDDVNKVVEYIKQKFDDPD
jgi:hypothetical protein